MKMYKFRYLKNRKKELVFAVIYISICCGIIGFCTGSLDNLGTNVWNLGYRAVAYFLGIVFFPLFLLLNFVYPKVLVEIDSQKMKIKWNRTEAQIIMLNEIDLIKLNSTALNRIDFYDRQHNLLTYFHDAAPKDTMKQILLDITGHSEFVYTAVIQRFFNRDIEVITCRRK